MSELQFTSWVGEGRFGIVRLLGEGATATVHLAWDHQRREWVAIKMLAPQVARRLSIQQRFEREARILDRLAHPNIVRVHELCHEGTLSYLVMELVDGGSLQTWLERFGPMPLGLAVDALLQVCGAVQAAHAAGVIHRDLKPPNVLVAPGGVCRVADFGIARGVEDFAVTRTGVTMGTLGFMAPEQVENAKGVDHRADIFSLGATLYTLLTARTPTALPDDLDRHPVPDELAVVVMRATLRRPAHRYASVTDLGRALRASLDALPAVPEGTPPLYQPDAQVTHVPTTRPTFVPED